MVNSRVNHLVKLDRLVLMWISVINKSSLCILMNRDVTWEFVSHCWYVSAVAAATASQASGVFGQVWWSYANGAEQLMCWRYFVGVFCHFECHLSLYLLTEMLTWNVSLRVLCKMFLVIYYTSRNWTDLTAWSDLSLHFLLCGITASF